jgi:hypothetical protein
MQRREIHAHGDDERHVDDDHVALQRVDDVRICAAAAAMFLAAYLYARRDIYDHRRG